MKNLKQKSILFLVISSLLVLSACGTNTPSTSETGPSASHLFEFDENGIGVLHGQVTGGGHGLSPTPKITLDLQIPVEVDNTQALVLVRFNVAPNAEISSSITSPTTMQDHLNSKSGANPLNAFPSINYVEVTFVKVGNTFQVTSAQEVEEGFSFFKKQPTIENLFITNGSSGVLTGSIYGSSRLPSGETTWLISVPVDMQGVTVEVILPVYSGSNTQNSDISWGKVKIYFTKRNDKLIADQIVELQ